MNKILVEGLYGHGGIHRKQDLRDYKYGKHLGQGGAPFDWEKGYDVEDITTYKDPTKNQGTSFSCGGQSLAYYLAQLTNVPRSAKNAYSQIFYPGGGTDSRSIGKLATNKGVSLESLVSSYKNGNPPDEAFMEDTSQNTYEAAQSALSAIGSNFAFVPPNIDAYAEALRDNNGIIMQIDGYNNGTWRSEVPKPPSKDIDPSLFWSHFMYCPAAKTYLGQKSIKVHNSWGADVGQGGYQWINEDYFNSGNVYEGLIISPSGGTIKLGLLYKLLSLYQKLLNLLSR